MTDGRKVCRRDCPGRSAECRLTCEKYKAYRAEKLKEYDRRVRAIESNPLSRAKIQNSKKKAKDKMRGR